MRSDDSARVELVFRRGQASADELLDAIDAILAELRDPQSQTRRQALAVGVDPDVLGAAQVAVEEGEQGIEPVLTTIAVGIVITVGGEAVTGAWKKLIWPLLEKRLGGLSLGEQLSGDHGQADPSRTDDGESSGGRAGGAGSR